MAIPLPFGFGRRIRLLFSSYALLSAFYTLIKMNYYVLLATR